MSRRQPVSRRVRNVIGIIVIVGLTIYGAVLLGLGVSGFVNAHALASSGKPALAEVTATSGYGENTIQVSYPVNGQLVQGTVGASTSAVHDGQFVSVVYDPGNPQVVSLASDVGDTSSAWGETIAGVVVMLPLPLGLLLAFIGRRRRRRRAIRAALGD
jgi:Protein of unknown function (DUF3592)